MRKTLIITSAIFGGAFTTGSSEISAQTFGMEYTTEWQTDFKGAYDWLNLLKTSAQVPVYRNLAFEASTISVAKTGDYTLIDDMLTYSNIEAGNIPLTFARLGLSLSVSDVQLFLGINNVNEDYFTSELTSMFTNSSFGISPTLSCNYDIANYPLASWCLHVAKQWERIALQSSLYPGQGYSRILGHDNLFTLKPGRDGIFSISSIDYKANGINTVLGVALHYGMCIGDEDGEQISAPAPASEKRFSASPWFLSEIGLPHNFGLVVHGSGATVKNGCKAYAGIGAIYSHQHWQPGVAFNYASFTSSSEYTVEFTCRIPVLSDKAYFQPTLHLVSTDRSKLNSVGMLRFNLAI